MAKVLDVASYILQERGPMTAMKLQKLCYYSQAWFLVWDEELLFEDDIEAWANGPVVRSLYNQHRGRLTLNSPADIGGDPTALDDSERYAIDTVLDAYGDKSAHWLSELTHSEAPWNDARQGLSDRERCNAVILPSAMHEYYDSLTSEDADAL